MYSVHHKILHPCLFAYSIYVNDGNTSNVICLLTGVCDIKEGRKRETEGEKGGEKLGGREVLATSGTNVS